MPATPEQGALTVAAVARRLGVAPTTLRTWDRRYGLGPTHHQAGTHRRYGPDDVRRLEAMRRLVLRGVPAADAAQLALRGAATETPTAPDTPTPERLPAAGSASLVRAAAQMDGSTVLALVGDSLDRRGAVPTWQDMVLPVLVELGRRWERTGTGVEVEHAAAHAVQGALAAYRHRILAPDETLEHGRRVLLACAPEEQHDLPLHALSAALAERRVPVRLLGARVPPEALAAAIRRTGPRAVFLWSSLRATGDPALLTALPHVRPAPLIVLGGPGWDRDRLPAGPVGPVVADELAQAVATLADAARD